jgi:predicted enzyme related to lactoylglutathione lyase
MAGNGYVHWNELMTSDVEKSKAFYGRALGWTFSEMPTSDGKYWIAMPPGGQTPAAGMMQFTGGPTDHWFTYIHVDDLDGALAAARESGGRILREPFTVEGVGRIAIVADLTGAAIGWITPEGPTG